MVSRHAIGTPSLKGWAGWLTQCLEASSPFHVIVKTDVKPMDRMQH